MGKKSRERMTGLSEEKRIKLSIKYHDEVEEQKRQERIKAAQALAALMVKPELLTTPLHPKGEVVEDKVAVCSTCGKELKPIIVSGEKKFSCPEHGQQGSYKLKKKRKPNAKQTKEGLNITGT